MIGVGDDYHILFDNSDCNGIAWIVTNSDK